MEVDVYQTDGRVEKKIALPEVFGTAFNEDIVRRALLAEQSREYQPQGRYLLAGMDTSASYTGRYGTYRTQRHTGLPPRPRQRLAKGGMGAVRKIPSSVKGRRAHPQKVEKTIIERINRKEYEKALSSAVAGTGNSALIKQNHTYQKGTLPLVVSSQIEKISRTRELLKVLSALGLSEDISRSHDPRLNQGKRRKVAKRYFRNSVLIVAKDSSSVEKAGRNIPGVDVLGVDRMKVEKLAPGARPRLTVWSEAAFLSLAEGIGKSVMNARGTETKQKAHMVKEMVMQ
ncbi:MAG: 50S ribosomal protein L4 [Candidatus Micrarchaeota archaeon]|nr:50S ribosomal protein L4 [Candidatus Micrarchaeota archaeon]